MTAKGFYPVLILKHFLKFSPKTFIVSFSLSKKKELVRSLNLCFLCETSKYQKLSFCKKMSKNIDHLSRYLDFKVSRKTVSVKYP